MKKIFGIILLSVMIILLSCLLIFGLAKAEKPQTKGAQKSSKYLVQVVTQEVVNLNTSESAWLPLQIQDKLKSNLQSYLGMKTVVDSKAESTLKKLQAASEEVGRDENAAIELGKITTAKYGLFTKVRKIGVNYAISVDFTDLTTGEQLASCMSKEYSKAEYLYGNTGAVDEITLALADQLGIQLSELNKNYLTSGSTSFSVDEQLVLAKENEAQYKKMMANYDAELAELAKSNDINAIQNQKRIEAEKALLQEKQNAEIKRQAELQAQKERAEADKKLEAERSIALISQRDKLAQEAAAKAAEVRKLKMEKQGVLGQINIIESKKKALVEIRQGVENRSIELFNQMKADIKSEFERITNKTYSTVELGSDGQPTKIALTRREKQKIEKYDELHKKFYADCESVKQATMSQQNALLQEIIQDQTNLTKPRTVSSMGDELKVSFGPYEGSKNGWTTYLSLYSDGILVYTDTGILSYEGVTGKKAPNMETELNDSVIEEYTNNVDMYSSLLTRGDPILYFVLEYSVKAKDQNHPSEYDFTYTNLKVYNTVTDKLVRIIKLNKTESKIIKPQQDLRIYDGIVEKEKQVDGLVNEIISELNWKIESILSNKFVKQVKSATGFYVANLIESYLVKIPRKDFKMLKTEVTQELYEYVMGENPSHFQGKNHPPAEGEIQEKRPVECVSYFDAIYFCNKASILCGLEPVYSVNGITNPDLWNYTPHERDEFVEPISWNQKLNGFRLPTEKEIKYASKIFTIWIGPYPIKFNRPGLWHESNSGNKTHEVGKKKANRYGLFDTDGNVSEWRWHNSRDSFQKGGVNCYDGEGHCYLYDQSVCWGFRIVCSDQ